MQPECVQIDTVALANLLNTFIRLENEANGLRQENALLKQLLQVNASGDQEQTPEGEIDGPAASPPWGPELPELRKQKSGQEG